MGSYLSSRLRRVNVAPARAQLFTSIDEVADEEPRLSNTYKGISNADRCD